MATRAGQFKSFTTRRFRADLHYRMRLLAAAMGVTQESLFNDIVAKGLADMEQEHTGLTASVRGQETQEQA